MSKYCWEQGTIVLPRSAWASFKKSLRDEFNKQVAFDREMLVRLYEKVKLDNKGKRNVNWGEVVEAELYKTKNVGRWQVTENVYAFRSLPLYDVTSILVPAYDANDVFIPVPTRKLIAPNKTCLFLANSKTTSFKADDGSIHLLDDKRHEVTWTVSENNHAVERARESAMGQVFFSLLGRIPWTRGTGGVIKGNDEINRDPDEGGGDGSHYITATFGPLGEKAKEEKHSVFSSRRRSSRAISNEKKK